MLQFYNKTQFGVRTAILYSGSQLGNAFGGLFAIGIFELDGAHGIEGWRWLFISNFSLMPDALQSLLIDLT